MKFLKTFLGLFCALYIPLMLLVGIVMKPRDPKMTALQAALVAALPFAVLILTISLGYATLTTVMDKVKEKEQPKK
ncbi:MAG: hypothetical protein WCI55_16140 [Armatimonadota bacterium]